MKIALVAMGIVIMALLAVIFKDSLARRRIKDRKATNRKAFDPDLRLPTAPANMAVAGQNSFTGEDKLTHYVRMCIEAHHASTARGIVLGFETSPGLFRHAVLTTADYSSPEEIDEQTRGLIEGAKWLQELEKSNSDHDRLYKGWVNKICIRLRKDSEAHEHTNSTTSMEIQGWFKSAMDFMVAYEGKEAAWEIISEKLKNASNEPSDGQRHGTTTLTSLSVKIRAHLYGHKRVNALSQSAFAMEAIRQQQP